MPHFCQSKQFVHLYYSSAFLKLCRKQGGWLSGGGGTRCSLSSSSSPHTTPHSPHSSPPPPPRPPHPPKVGAAFFLPSSLSKRRARRRKEGRVSLGAHGQLIVCSNVFHLHVYTVNSGGGCLLLPFPYGSAIVWRHLAPLTEAEESVACSR